VALVVEHHGDTLVRGRYDGEYLESFVTPESMRTVVFAGKPDAVAALLRRMADAGVDQATLQIAGPPPSWCERMGAAVLPAAQYS
jgi:alkanesulfonate monooxygenase SsuD/methylene tetrahydromethanopterin reductase-like flavin-dependent oxidoreductase (luciferase family)